MHEQYIFRALLAARALPGTKSLDEPRQKILDRVIGELQRISLIRGREWDRQLIHGHRSSNPAMVACSFPLGGFSPVLRYFSPTGQVHSSRASVHN